MGTLQRRDIPSLLGNRGSVCRESHTGAHEFLALVASVRGTVLRIDRSPGGHVRGLSTLDLGGVHSSVVLLLSGVSPGSGGARAGHTLHAIAPRCLLRGGGADVRLARKYPSIEMDSRGRGSGACGRVSLWGVQATLSGSRLVRADPKLLYECAPRASIRILRRLLLRNVRLRISRSADANLPSRSTGLRRRLVWERLRSD